MKAVGTNLWCILLLPALIVSLAACAVAPPTATLRAPTPTMPPEQFAIYLLAAPMSPAAVQKADLSSLVLADVPLVTGADLIRYRRVTHTMQLSPSADAAVRSLPVTTSGVPFVVCIGKKPIYRGAFWSSLSSQSFEGVVIDILRGERDRTVRIQLGYPESPELFIGEDPRADPRILQALAAAGKLE